MDGAPGSYREGTQLPMKIDQFLGHYGIVGNPFSEEDAQTDTVFKSGCLWKIHHPAWNKFFGSATDPSTALVFGEKGSGKTALRLQAAAEFEAYNKEHPDRKVFVIEYDDFNPFLDHFAASVRARVPADALKRWRLQDHMDAILALGVTRLVDELTAEKRDLTPLSEDQRRDLLMLAALYDQSTGEPIERRWNRLRTQSRFRSTIGRRDLQIGVSVSVLVAALLVLGLAYGWPAGIGGAIYAIPLLLVALAAGWIPWAWRLQRSTRYARDIRRGLRVLSRDPSALRRELMWFSPTELGGQPLPTASASAAEERYELLRKFIHILGLVGYQGIIVLIDRVDEPQLIEGDPRKMRALVWPLLDHKFLRHPGIGIKMLLPIELAYYLEKEEKEFYDKARPDKLNMIKPLRWTGPSLYDLATDRLRACVPDPESNGEAPRLRQFIDASISDDSLRDALGNLRTPRQLFKFMHRLIEEHCHRHTEDSPRWDVDSDTFRTVYSAHMRELEAFDRGYGHG